MKKVIKKMKKSFINYFNLLIKYIRKNQQIILKSLYILCMSIPFLILDISTRYFGRKINFFALDELVPNFFTFIWIFLIISICLSLKKNNRKIIYSFFIILSLIFFLVNNVYYSTMGSFFDFSLLGLASEGSSYMIDSLKSANKIIYLIIIIVITLSIFIVKYMPTVKKNDFKMLLVCILAFLGLHLFVPTLLGDANSDLSWNTWRNPRNIYISFNDNNKSMSLAGLYEYTFRNFYITYLKEKKTDNEEEKEFLELVYDVEEENYSNKYTGYFSGKNVIFLQLEGIDNWLINSVDTPTLYSMMNNSFVFNKHYSYYNGGGSTFNSEFAINTGYLTPISYTQNAYTFNKNTFNYSLANLFKNKGYSVNAFHMNTSEYYSRGTNYRNWGYDNYYGLKDLDYYTDSSYELDRELILNEVFYEKLIPEEGNFLNYIITYSNHTPFTTEKGVCKKLIYEDMTTGMSEEEILNTDIVLPILSEEECTKRQAKETDYMVNLLLQMLTDKGVIDNTVIVAFADHYLYTLTDQTILEKYKDTSNNLINNTPFFIWSKDMKKVNINEVTSQLNILPTILNLFGMEYHPNYYIGEDALNPNYKGYVFFSDYSWYDGNVYVEGGEITNGKYMEQITLEDKNYYINYLIRKNDLALKYNYFKNLKNKNTEI